MFKDHLIIFKKFGKSIGNKKSEAKNFGFIF